MRKQKILILGGGFGGLYAALELEKLLGRRPDVEVTLVNRENFFLFTPMLHEVAASDLDIAHIVNPLHKLLKRTGFFCGDVESIDLPARRVRVCHGSGQQHHSHELPYDHLVIAMGAVTDFSKVPGLSEHALGMRSLGDAVCLRNTLIERLKVADSDCFVAMREPLLTFVIAGGGFAGVETAGAVNDFLRHATSCYPNLSASRIRVVLVHSGQVLLPELDEKLGRYAERKLGEHGIEVILKARVQAASASCVTLDDGSTIAAQTLIWTAGNGPNPLLAELPCPMHKGRIKANEFLQVLEWPGVWALGDAAMIPDGKGSFYPPTAQHALREGKTIARNIEASLNGEKLRPFRFKILGQLAAIRQRSGVANVFGLRISGFVAWSGALWADGARSTCPSCRAWKRSCA